MGKNIQSPPAGHHCDLLRSGSDLTGQSICIVCILEQKQNKQAPDWHEALACARQWQSTNPVKILACHIQQSDLSHYGRMDHLAPASAMIEFENYVMEMSQESAANAFASLLSAAAQEPAVSVEVKVVFGKKELPALLEALSAQEKIVLFDA